MFSLHRQEQCVPSVCQYPMLKNRSKGVIWSQWSSVMATEGASQSDFVPVTTGDLKRLPLWPRAGTIIPLYGCCCRQCHSHTTREQLLSMMNFMTYFALFGVFLILLWNSIKNNSGKRTGLLFCLLWSWPLFFLLWRHGTAFVYIL